MKDPLSDVPWVERSSNQLGYRTDLRAKLGIESPTAGGLPSGSNLARYWTCDQLIDQYPHYRVPAAGGKRNGGLRVRTGGKQTFAAPMAKRHLVALADFQSLSFVRFQ
ncbi:hypothetical protein GCM10022280_19010 [Sphingomonas swuensis]|uniref:Uncharacterized protein n=1 Tax=Sphingomonas swuensis TaxID=977800 RepID=A0ABP7T179_9SPHN